MTCNNQPSMFGQEAGTSEAPASPSAEAIKDDQLVGPIMYALTGPLIGFPGWEDLLKDHKDKITMYRLAHALDIFREKQATEYEAMLYIMTVSLTHPISHDWAAIYGHLFCKLYPEQGKAIWEDDFDHKLGPNRQEMLTKLRRWLFKTQMDHLKQKKDVGPAAKRTAQKKTKEAEDEQSKMF